MPYPQSHASVVQPPPVSSSFHPSPAPSLPRQPLQYKYSSAVLGCSTAVLTYGSFSETATGHFPSRRRRAAAADCRGSWNHPVCAVTGLRNLATIVDGVRDRPTSTAAAAATSVATSLELQGEAPLESTPAVPYAEKGLSILRAFIAKHGVRAELVSEVTPGSLPAGQGIVKSIVMVEEVVAQGRSEGPQLVPLLVVVRLEDRVDERRVAELLQVPRRRVRLARVDEVLAHTGFAVGTVPPLVDTAVTRLTVVHGGGGDPDKDISVAVPDLLSYSNGIVADVSVGTATATATMSTSGGGATAPQPPLPLPWPPGSQSVDLVGVVAQRRRIARLLQFVNLVPEQLVPVLPRGGQAVFLRRLWRHPESGQPVEVQLILGKTLERNVGRDKAQALMDQVKIGSIVAIRGRVQAHPGAHRAITTPTATATATATAGSTGSPTPASTAVPQPPQQQQTSPRATHQSREDVLDVVCHSVTVVHKNKDHLNDALRAAKRAGLGSPTTAAELLRLQQLRGQQPWPLRDESSGSRREEPLTVAVAVATVGTGMDAVERPAVLEGFKLGQPPAGGRSSTDPWVSGCSSVAGISSNSASVLSNRQLRRRRQQDQQQEVDREDGGERTRSLEAPLLRNRSTTMAQTDRRGGGGCESVGAAEGGEKGPWRPEDEGGRATKSRPQETPAAALAVTGKVTGWRMRLPLAAVRLVSTAAGVAEMQQEIFAFLHEEEDGEQEEEREEDPAERDAEGRDTDGVMNVTATATAPLRLADPARVVALDCEWAPYERHQPKNPVSILQIATRDRVYLLDLLSLMAPAEPKQLRNHLQHHRQEKHVDNGDCDGEDDPRDYGHKEAEEERVGAVGAVAVAPAPAPAPARVDRLSQSALAVSDFLTRLMSSGRIVKLGFQLVTDLDRLCESYPHLPCFTGSCSRRSQPAVPAGSASADAAATAAAAATTLRSSSVDLSDPAFCDVTTEDNGSSTAGSWRAGRPRAGSRGGSNRSTFAETTLRNQCRLCVDVVTLARCLRQDLTRTPQISLSRLVALVLGEPLDKTQQASNWACRPLTEEQVLYAATDAYCLIALYDALLGLNDCSFEDEEEIRRPATLEKLERAGKVLQVVALAVKCLPLKGLRTARTLGEAL